MRIRFSLIDTGDFVEWFDSSPIVRLRDGKKCLASHTFLEVPTRSKVVSWIEDGWPVTARKNRKVESTWIEVE